MRARKLLLASIGLMCINTSVQGEEWGVVKCRAQCTQASCADAAKKELCQNNCGHHDESSILKACNAAMPALPSKPQPNPRPVVRGLPKPVDPIQPTIPPESKGDVAQSQSDSETEETAPELEKPTTRTIELQPTLPQRSQNLPSEIKRQPSEHHVTGSGGKGVTAEQMNALNEGKGVKVKHMKEKIEGLENLIGALQKRIGLLEPLAEHAFGAHELLTKLQKNTGFDKPEIRNDPEHDIEYKPEQFSTASSASGTLDGTSCQAVLTRVEQKTKETKDKIKSKKLANFGAQLTEMCKLTKDLNRTPGKKVRDAESVNRIFGEAKKLF